MISSAGIGKVSPSFMPDTSPSSVATLPVAPIRSPDRLSRAGVAATVGAFVIWGGFPLYLAGLTHISAMQITAHRIVWSFVFVLGWMAARGELGALRAAAARPGVMTRLIASAVFITVNWLAFVWAINAGHVTDVSLGYYINPLVNVFLGIFVLSERLNRMQWTAVAIAAAGVAYLTFETGHVPWAALIVAMSFALYGFIRKTANVEALPGLAIELTLLLPFAIGYLLWCEFTGIGAMGHSGIGIDLLFLFSGPLTAIPLFLFAYGARLIPYSTVGVLQYIGPSGQLACAVWFFGEPFGRANAIGFVLIWTALLLYAVDGLLSSARQRRTAALQSP
jgi:chloramphenicol-sensitive protein RarD